MRLANITWPQAEAYFQENDIVIIGTGSIECHGRHMPLGTDTMIPDHILELVEKKSNVLIAPTIPYGSTYSLEGFPGTINLGSELFYQLLLTIVDELFACGARRFVILNGHGGNTQSIERVGYQVQKNGGILANINWWSMVWEMNPAWKGGHGGGEEASAVMAINPALIDQSEINTPVFMKDLSENMKASSFRAISFKGISVDIPRMGPSVTNNGWTGSDHPSTATEKWGKDMMSATADFIVEFAEEFKKVDIEEACKFL